MKKRTVFGGKKGIRYTERKRDQQQPRRRRKGKGKFPCSSPSVDDNEKGG